MAKPSVTLRNTKGAALTYSELDTNFTNLKDATLTLTAGSGGTSVTADLNGTITIVAGTNITVSGDNSAKTITINSTGGSGSLNVNTITLGDNVSGDVSLEAATANGSLSLVASAGNRLTIRDDATSTLQSGTEFQVISDQIRINNSSTGSATIKSQTNSNALSGLIIDTTFIRLPNRTTTERNAVTAANGMVIYNTTDNKLQVYANGAWVDLH